MNRKPRGYWTKENCLNASSKCSSRSQFKKEYYQAWKTCKDNDWLDEACSHMEKSTSINGYGFWQDYDHCFSVASQCTSASEFEKRFPQAYKVAVKNNWRQDYTWFQNGRRNAALNRTKWTFESCSKESTKYKTLSEFRRGSSGAYHKAWKMGWLDSFTWFNKGVDIYGRPDCVYKYEFTGFNSVYIGRTINKAERNYAHIFNTDNDAVATFAREHNIPVPEMVILADNLTLSEGQELEDVWRNYYIEQGYNVLNKARTGRNKGSLGSIGWGKWNYETCYNEAKKYKSRKAFQKGNVSAYTRALQYKWMEDYYWFDKARTGQNRWTRDRCFEEAKKYYYIEDFHDLAITAYRKSRKNGWFNEYVWLSRKPMQKTISKSLLFWTKERCFEEAKKYRSRTEFQYSKGAYMAYKISLKNGWIDEYEWMKPNRKVAGYWDDYGRCLEEARKYRTRTEFQYAKGASAAYKSAVKHGWIEQYDWMTQPTKPKGFWSKEKCLEESKKYQTRYAFRVGSPSAYAITQRNGWLNDCVWLKPPKTRDKWTYDTCKTEAKKYETRGQFRKDSPTAYKKCINQGWIDEFFPK